MQQMKHLPRCSHKVHLTEIRGHLSGHTPALHFSLLSFLQILQHIKEQDRETTNISTLERKLIKILF